MGQAAWRYYLAFYRESQRAVFLTTAVAIGQAFLLFPIGLIVRYVFDQAIPARDVTRLLLASLVVLLLYLANDGATLWLRFQTLRVVKRAIAVLRGELLKKLYALSREYYSHADLGKLHASIVQDSERLDVMSFSLLSQLLPAVLTALVLSVALLILNWILFLVLFSAAPLLYLLSRAMWKKTRASVVAFNRAYETFSQGILFVLQQMDLTRLQVAEPFEAARQLGYASDLRETSERMSRLQGAYVSLHRTIVVVSNVVILIIGGIMVGASWMTLGELLSFYVVVALMKDDLLAILYAIPQILTGHESLITLYRFVLTDSPLPYRGTGQIAFAGEIRFESVDFQYADEPTLRDINLTIHPGDRIALVGPNGAGKSTLTNLLLGFYRPQNGLVLADGRRFDDLDLTQVRGRIGVVAQDPLIFPGTIAENISYGCPDATAEQIRRVAEIATADEFIARLPRGYETLVGESGMLMSGGQRQRIVIARALLREPALLILDEPTNHLTETVVQQLMENLRRLAYAPAILIISHDARIVREADIVYAMDAGRIVSTHLNTPRLPTSALYQNASAQDQVV